MTEVTSLGFLRTRLDERYEQLKEAVRAIFGEDIDLDPDSIDGQTLGIFAEAISNLDQLAEDTYNSFNPQSATGAALARLVQLNGIRQLTGAYSLVDLLCGGTTGTLIPAGSLVKSATTGYEFQTINDATIGGDGTVVVPARAQEYGSTAALAGTLTKISTPWYGWQTVTNPSDAVIGRAQETDEQLRIRRRRSTSTPATAIVDSMRGALSNLNGVLQAEVYENYTGAVDSNGQIAHSIYCVVEGGDEQEIWDTIFAKKSAGCDMVGTSVGTTLDSYGNPHQIKFSRPTDVNVYVVINLAIRAGWPTDGVQRIQDAIVAWSASGQSIGEEVIQSRIFEPVNSVPGHSVASLFIGTTANPATADNIEVTFDQLARFSTSRIIVNAT